MSQAQQNQAQPAASTSQASTPAPVGQTSSVATIPAQSQSTASGSQSQAVPAAGPSQTRMAAEQARKDRTLADFMLLLDDYEPLVSSLLCPRNTYSDPSRYQTKSPTTTYNVLVLKQTMFDCKCLRSCCGFILTSLPMQETTFGVGRAEIRLGYRSGRLPTCTHPYKCRCRWAWKGTLGSNVEGERPVFPLMTIMKRLHLSSLPGQDSDNSHDGGLERCTRRVWHQCSQARVLHVMFSLLSNCFHYRVCTSQPLTAS